MHLIKSFFKLSNDRKFLIIMIIALTLLIRIFLYILPFSRIYHISNKLARLRINQENPKQIRDIIWAVKLAANLVPGVTCLVQAITAQLLMTHNKHDSILRIGVNKSDHFEAHAWVEMDNEIILGDSQMDYVPLLDLESKI